MLVVYQLFIRAALARNLVLCVPVTDSFEDEEVHGTAVMFVLAHDGFGCGVVYLELLGTLYDRVKYFFDFARIA